VRLRNRKGVSRLAKQFQVQDTAKSFEGSTEVSCNESPVRCQRTGSPMAFAEHEVEPTIIGKPLLQRIETLDSFLERLFPQGVETKMDWRTKRLKDFIDNAPSEVSESLGHVCIQLHLSISVARMEQPDRNLILFLAEKVAHKRDKKVQNGAITQIRKYNYIR
jgi:hypothetical protein